MDGENNSGAAKAFTVKYCDFCHRAIALGYNSSRYSETVCSGCDGPLAYLYAEFVRKQVPKPPKKYHCANCSKVTKFRHTHNPPIKRADDTYIVRCENCASTYHTSDPSGILAYE